MVEMYKYVENTGTFKASGAVTSNPPISEVYANENIER
jgi:hypothetical protein